MDVSDQGGLLRVRDGGQPLVTPLELFFDLVFVFAVTQLANRLLVHLTLGGTLETLFLLLAGLRLIRAPINTHRSPLRFLRRLKHW